jgi:hypothetical protein
MKRKWGERNERKRQNLAVKVPEEDKTFGSGEGREMRNGRSSSK